jgi:glycosyltransferase involved in cell wall biosynthesis
MPRVLFRGGPIAADGVHGRSLGFVNLLGAKHVTRFLNCLWSGTRALRRWRPQVLLIHGVHSPHLWFGVLARRLAGVRAVVVLTDPPGVVLPSDGPVARTLKSLDVRLVRAALSSMDGVIALTAALARDYAPRAPRLVLEGISDTRPEQPHAQRRGGTGTTLLYAGGLSASYGVDRLVEAVKGIDRPGLRLRTLGKGELAGWIDAEADPRIAPAEFLPRAEVLAAYRSADLLVQPRPVDQDFVRYSFPSKLLEYLASGTPVLTTRLSGIPGDYEGHVGWIDDDSTEGIRAAIAAALDTPRDELIERGRAAAEFVRSTRGPAAQGRRMREFLGSVLGVSRACDR